jgi:S-adenosyl methyltransferase
LFGKPDPYRVFGGSVPSADRPGFSGFRLRSEWAHARTSADKSQALLSSARRADELQPHIGDDRFAHEVYGMLHLSAALASAVQGDHDGPAGGCVSEKALASAEPGSEDIAGRNVIEDSYPGRQDDDALPQEDPGGFDQRVPNAARIYDWLIGGKDHYAADRAAGRRLAAAIPGIRQAATDNRTFLARVTRYLAAEAGISQFIDIGSGLPGPGPVHEIAREAQPGARVVYVDHDRCKSGCAHAC